MIGGKVLDASALAALARGRLSALAWVSTARQVGIALYVPTLALAEVRSVLLESGPALATLVGHPSVLLGELDARAAEAVAAQLERTEVWDGLAGHVVHIAQERGWPVLTTDPGRIRRLAPDVEITEL